MAEKTTIHPNPLDLLAKVSSMQLILAALYTVVFAFGIVGNLYVLTITVRSVRFGPFPSVFRHVL